MSATQLHEAGFGPLVSVVPPDGELHPSSTIKDKDKGKAPAILRDGKWAGYAFTKTVVGPETIEATGANTGLLGDRFPGLDIDVDEPTLAKVVQQFAEEKLGETAVRLSREPRRLLVYRTGKPFARVALVITYKGKSHTVEFLGQGRQYLVHGGHPSGVDYRWEGQDLWDYMPSDLPSITGEVALSFLTELKEALAGKAECELVGTGKTKTEAVKPQDDLEAPSAQALSDLLLAMPNPEEWDRAKYVQVACAVKASGGELEDFTAWSQKHPSFDAAHDVKTWDSLGPPYRVGWSWLQEQAAQITDYVPAVDVFEAVDRPAGEEPKKKVAQAPAGAPETDEQVVQLILPEVKNELRYVAGSKRWYIWAGHVWEYDQVMLHEMLVRDKLGRLAQVWKSMAAAAPNKAQREPWTRIASKYQNKDGISAICRLVQAKLAVAPSSFDPDPWVLNTPGAPYNLKTCEPVERDPAMMLTRSTAVTPAKGTTVFWDQFLKDLTGNDKELIRYLQTMCGYALTGDISEKTLWFIWGSNSDTGKSTFIRVLTRILGSYADTVDASVFVGSTNRIPAELARLPGVRLVAATEPKSGHAWDEKRIKAITGGDSIECRFLYGQPFTYDPQFKILIVGNHEPEIENVDDAMLRRVHIVPINTKVPRAKQIDNLAAKLVEREGPAILHWMMQGCLRWSEEGLTPPNVVLKRTEEYADEENTLQQWINSECETGDDAEATSAQLYSAYSMWCRERGELPGGLRQLSKRLAAVGFRKMQLGKRRDRGFRGIRLRPQVEFGTEEVIT